jgi:hypothetical protein
LKRDFSATVPLSKSRTGRQDDWAVNTQKILILWAVPAGRPRPMLPLSLGGAYGVVRAVPSWLTPYKETIRTLQRQGAHLTYRRQNKPAPAKYIVNQSPPAAVIAKRATA